MTRELLQQALDALESLQDGCTDSDDGTVEAITVWCPELIDALRAALAAPQPEPDDYQMLVGGVRWTHCAKHIYDACIKEGVGTVRALYAAAPAPAVPTISPLALRALRMADMALASWENGYAFDSHGPGREAQRLVTAALALSAAPAVPRHVRKIGGSFQHTGTVVADFKTTAGEPRIVLEFDAPVAGMLHVYRPDQVEPS